MVGRHALFFDDDAMATFVNSGNALVDWNSLQIDRYDVRHLLSAPLPPRRRRNPQIPLQLPDFAFESELDQERYLDLDLSSPSDEPGSFFFFNFIFKLVIKYSFSLLLEIILLSIHFCVILAIIRIMVCNIGLEFLSR